jgi:hypothetical protein
MAMIGKKLVVVDAREPTEIDIFCIEITNEMPLRLRRSLAKNSDMGKFKFHNVYFDDGAEGTDGLTDDDLLAEDFLEFFEAASEQPDGPPMRAEMVGAKIDFWITWISA